MSADAWVITLACNRADAEAMPDIGDVFADLADPPSLNVEEPDPDRPDAWVMTAYCNDKPDAGLVARIAVLFPSGMAATAALLATTLKPGQKIVMPSDSQHKPK